MIGDLTVRTVNAYLEMTKGVKDSWYREILKVEV